MKPLKYLLLFLTVLFFSCSAQPQHKSFFIANWNLENLFDTKDDQNKSDEEFLPNSPRHWTAERLNNKLKNLARVIKNMNDNKGPDLLGVEEVEHKYLLESMISKYIKRKNYKIAYAESPDHRGIDNGLIYNTDLFKLIDIEKLTIPLKDNHQTRYILHVIMKFKNSKINVFVNHWPSRREGLKKSEPNRIAAATILRKSVNKIFSQNSNANILILGDFNDLPSNISINRILKAKELNCNSASGISKNNLYNLSLKLFREGKGSYKYRSHWNMLDQVIVSGNLINGNLASYKCSSFQIIKPPFMVEHGGRYEGYPLPTYGGRKYLGGYSDHFPVGAKFLFN